MGLDIIELPLYNGATTINCYANIRDIQQNKDDLGKYTLCFNVTFSVNNLYIKCKNLEQVSDNISTDIWSECYIILKAYLDSINVSYSDVL